MLARYFDLVLPHMNEGQRARGGESNLRDVGTGRQDGGGWG
jgi:hypothetical protein